MLDDPGLADPDHPDLDYEAQIAEGLRREAEAEAGARMSPLPASHEGAASGAVIFAYIA